MLSTCSTTRLYPVLAEALNVPLDAVHLHARRIREITGQLPVGAGGRRGVRAALVGAEHAALLLLSALIGRQTPLDAARSLYLYATLPHRFSVHLRRRGDGLLVRDPHGHKHAPSRLRDPGVSPADTMAMARSLLASAGDAFLTRVLSAAGVDVTDEAAVAAGLADIGHHSERLHAFGWTCLDLLGWLSVGLAAHQEDAPPVVFHEVCVRRNLSAPVATIRCSFPPLARWPGAESIAGMEFLFTQSEDPDRDYERQNGGLNEWASIPGAAVARVGRAFVKAASARSTEESIGGWLAGLVVNPEASTSETSKR